MKRFRPDNTEGYNDDELALLNAIWDEYVLRIEGPFVTLAYDEDKRKSWLDNYATTLLDRYELYKRDWTRRMENSEARGLEIERCRGAVAHAERLLRHYKDDPEFGPVMAAKLENARAGLRLALAFVNKASKEDEWP